MPMPYTYRTLAAVMALSLLASGCVFYPKATRYNDPQCNKDRYQLNLEMDIMSNGGSCGGSGADCLAMLLAIGPLTYAVSGSVVAVGNSALWLEKTGDNFWLTRQGRCGNRPASPTSPLVQPENHPAPLAAQ